MEDSKNLCESSFMEEDLYESSSSSDSMEDYKNLCESLSSSDKDFHVRCEPVIDILSAKVFIDSNDTRSFDVYGYITIQDLKGSNKYKVYEQIRHKSPQSFYPTRMPNFLKLSGPKEIPTLNEPLLRVDILDDKSDRALFCGEERLFKTIPKPKMYYSLNQQFEMIDIQEAEEGSTTPKPKMHYSLNQQFEMIDTLRFQEAEEGSGHLEVKYVAFTFGVYVRVQMILSKDDDDDKKGVEVYGRICAKCNPLILPKKCYDNHMFNVIEDDHEWVGLGDKILLSKDLVAVPAYSELEISVDLMGYEDDGFFVQGTACFEPSNYRDNPKKIRGMNGYYVKVRVEWYQPSFLNEPCRDWNNQGGSYLMVPLPKQPMIYASPLLEVFSLFIARPNDKDVRLYGSVKVLDWRGSCDIFTCSKDEPYFLARGCNLLPLQGPNRAMIPGGLDFIRIKIDLSDIDGLFKINGYVGSPLGYNECQRRPWFDRRLCSVVRGDSANKKSFVAVNYTLFPFAVEAILTVRLVSYIGSVKIYGNITASYGMLSYSTEYDSKFFQRVLFTRKEAKYLEIGENLELSRCVVAVPMTSSLHTHVDLSFQSIDLPSIVDIVDIVTFNIGESKKVIKSGLVDIFIDVEWKGHSGCL